ncbi:hypothetical protein CDAR_10931 [Caerostris darwini]|uniref:Uncharacterized protein n=1 Tax=Caerostris darwini TaxID=1538125 RepID=A0AAV4W859_9ARAC|nr:hypothetical protein CDAR_10931 [Caerostris darwini]
MGLRRNNHGRGTFCAPVKLRFAQIIQPGTIKRTSRSRQQPCSLRSADVMVLVPVNLKHEIFALGPFALVLFWLAVLCSRCRAASDGHFGSHTINHFGTLKEEGPDD